MQAQKYVIQFSENPHKPPIKPVASINKRRSCVNNASNSPTPPCTPRRISDLDTTHFHRCESKSCLNQHHQQQQDQSERRVSNTSIGSYKSEKKMIINNRMDRERLFSASPSFDNHQTARITLKLLPEHRLAYKKYCNSGSHCLQRSNNNHDDEAQKRSCSWSANLDDETRRMTHSKSKESSLSQFTCIETISIKNSNPSFCLIFKALYIPSIIFIISIWSKKLWIF